MNAAESTIRQLLAEDRPRDLIDFFGGLDPKERRGLHKLSKTLLAEARAREGTFTTFGAHWEAALQQSARAALVFLCTATPAEVAARKSLPDALAWLHNWRRRAPKEPVLLYLIERLQPAWTNEFVELALQRDSLLWDVVLELVRRGQCHRPGNPQFFLRLVRDRLQLLESPHSLAENAIAEAGWLAPVLIEGFLQPEAEALQRSDLEPGEAPFSPPDGQRRPPADSSWHEAIRQLCERDLLDRARMTETIFGALAMHAKPSICKWLMELFDLLWPERDARHSWVERGDLGLLQALQAPATSVAPWALRHLEAALEAGKLAPRDLLGAMEPVMRKDSKAVIVKGLATLRKIVRKDRKLASAAAVQACGGLLLNELEVQERTLSFLEETSTPDDPEVRAVLAGYADAILPSLRERFLPWLGDALLDASVSTEDVGEAVTPPDPLADENRLAPITDLDEFISLLSNWFQDGSDGELLHRLLGAFGPLNGSPAAERTGRAAALTKLLATSVHDYSGSVAKSLRELVRTWLDQQTMLGRMQHGLGKMVARLSDPLAETLIRDYAGVITRELERRRGQAFHLLSTPTHRGGWIDPRELVTRLRAPDEPADPLDLTIALLRLGPGHRAEALEEARPLSGPSADLLRYALGDDSIPPQRNDPLWLAAIRARSPFGNPEVLQSWSEEYAFADGKTQAEFSVRTERPQRRELKFSHGTGVEIVPARIRLELVQPIRGSHVLTARHTAKAQHWWSFDAAQFAWLVSLWPANRHAFLPHAITTFSDQVEAGSTLTATTAEVNLVHCLLALPPHPLGPAGHLVLAMAMNSAGAATRQAAGEAFFQNACCGLIDAAEFGRQFAVLLRADYAKLNRLVPVLKDIAALSPLASRVVAEALSHALDLRDEPAPRLLNQLLEWMLELRARHPNIALSEASRHTLRTLGASGKTGQLVAKLTLEIHDRI